MARNLWKFEPREKQAAEPFRPAEAGEHVPKPPSVGEMLREKREQRGEDLRYVAQMLRIRYPYLKAIEEGLADDLPGPTYAIGFVRTYAEHLGLDAKDMVTRFKAEAEGLQSRNDLNFPAPIPEGKIPSGAILLVGIVIAALIYAVWIYMSSRDQAVSEAAKQPPTVAAVTANAPAASEQTARPPETVSAAQPAPAALPGAGESRAATPGVLEAPVENPVAPVVADKAKASGTGLATSASGREPETKKAELAPPPAPPTHKPSPVETSQTQPATNVVTEAAAVGGKTYGQSGGSARIVIHAVADSWVEVRDKATDELILTRVLFKGDSYYVPDRAGLTLLTGNAGGLRITVDGKDVPALGAVGSVRRDIALDPEQLKAGKRRVGATTQSSASSAPPTAGR